MLRATLLYSIFERSQPVTKYGSGNGAWNVVSGSLTSDSVVLAVGVGHDISFDLAVSEKHGCRILLLDPSPTGKATIERHSPFPKNMTFLPVGLSSKDGTVCFADPMHPDEGSYRISSDGGSSGPNSFLCRKLSTIMGDNDFKQIDLLKIDIEGFEYEVLDDLLLTRANVRQICVEFHHGVVPGITRMQTLKAILRLTFAGYQLCNHEGLNHTFIRRKRP